MCGPPLASFETSNPRKYNKICSWDVGNAVVVLRNAAAWVNSWHPRPVYAAKLSYSNWPSCLTVRLGQLACTSERLGLSWAICKTWPCKSWPPTLHLCYPYFFFTGFSTLKLHIKVSSIDIIAPALSNSPPVPLTCWPASFLCPEEFSSLP